jgi:hypothetical protein
MIVLLGSCGLSMVSEKEQQAAAKAAKAWKAEESEVEHKKETRGGQTLNVINVKLQNLSSSSLEYPSDFISSTTALIFISELSEADYNNYDELRIEVVNSSETNVAAFEIPRLVKTVKTLTEGLKFFDVFKAKDHNGLAEMVEGKFIPDTSLPKIFAISSRIDSVCGPIVKNNLVGFQYNKMEEGMQPIIKSFFESANEKCRIYYTIDFLEESGKIVYIGVSDKRPGEE